MIIWNQFLCKKKKTCNIVVQQSGRIHAHFHISQTSQRKPTYIHYRWDLPNFRPFHVRASGEGPRYFAKTEVLAMWLKWLYVVVITWGHMFRRRLGPYMALARRKIRSMLEKLKKVPKLKKILIFFNFSFFVEISHFS